MINQHNDYKLWSAFSKETGAVMEIEVLGYVSLDG